MHSRADMNERPAMSAPLAIGKAAISLFWVVLDTVATPQAKSAALATLSPQERQRANGFASELKRAQFVLAHGLLRTALSHAAPTVEPRAWRFRVDEHGRPHVAEPACTDRLYFSVSHTDGCVACALSVLETVGIDVETSARQRDVLGIAETWFSAKEIAALRAVPASDQSNLFFDIWTLKEAYIKARGLGLRLPLDRFSIMIEPPSTIRLDFAPGFDD